MKAWAALETDHVIHAVDEDHRPMMAAGHRYSWWAWRTRRGNSARWRTPRPCWPGVFRMCGQVVSLRMPPRSFSSGYIRVKRISHAAELECLLHLTPREQLVVDQHLGGRVMLVNTILPLRRSL